MLGKNWKQNREFILELGTKEYQKPARLADCEVVFDTPENRLTTAENYVEPVGALACVTSDTLLNVWGLPSIKKGFRIFNKVGEESRKPNLESTFRSLDSKISELQGQLRSSQWLHYLQVQGICG